MNEYGRVVANDLNSWTRSLANFPVRVGLMTDGTDSKSAGLSMWVHCGPLIIFGCLGKHWRVLGFISVILSKYPVKYNSKGIAVFLLRYI